LILPYNPVFGKVSVDSSLDDKAGPEFAEIPGLPALPSPPPSKLEGKGNLAKKADTTEKKPATQSATKKTKAKSQTKGKGNEAPPPPPPPPRPQQASEAVKANLESLNRQELRAYVGSDPNRNLHLAQALADTDEKFRSGVDRATQDLEHVRTDEIRVEAGVREVPLKVTEAFRRVPSDASPSPSEEQVYAEAKRRIEVLASPSGLYTPCLKTKGETHKSFEEDAEELENQLRDISFSSLTNQLDTMNRLIETLSEEDTPGDVKSPDSWKKQIDGWKDSLAEDRDYFKALSDEKKSLAQQLVELRKSSEGLRRALSSAATQLQVRFFSPLKDDQAITFKCTRLDVETDTSASRKVQSAQTIDCGSITLKPAPVQTFRLGSGIVVSHLYNPTFKVGPTADNATNSKTIQYDDRGNGQVQLGIFVHHYWGYRSGLLSRTTFERFAPTFSLGIPLTKADLLQQVLIGLDWELVPGIELNVGAHWGKVNSLIDHYFVGQTISTKVDITSLQEKRFRAAFYGGIVLNADIFKKLFDSQTSNSGN
jgi:hypothetical protein